MFLFKVYKTHDFVCLFLHLARGVAVGPVCVTQRSVALLLTQENYSQHVSMISDVLSASVGPLHTRTDQIVTQN